MFKNYCFESASLYKTQKVSNYNVNMTQRWRHISVTRLRQGANLALVKDKTKNTYNNS